MKRIVVAIGILWCALGCESERILFEGPYHVRFTEDADVRKESVRGKIPIEVHVAGPVPERSITVSYSVNGTAREGVDYRIVGTRGEIRINAGQFFGNIEIELINNANNILRSQNIVFRLESVSSEELQVGQGVSGIGREFTFTIEDDCILGGTYTGLRTVTSAPVEDISITSTDCEEYLLSNWDIDIFSFPQVRDLVFIDNADNTLTIPEQEELTLPDSQATIRGFGVVDPVTKEITMTVILLDFSGQPQATFRLIPE